MGLIHQLAEPLQIADAQRADGPDRACIFINHMTRSLRVGIVHDHVLGALELIRIQIAQMVDVADKLQLLQRFAALGPARVVRRIDQRMLHFAVRDDDLRVPQMKRHIFVADPVRIQKDRAALPPHRGRELVHNPAVHSDKLTLGTLA